ncbi:hypothetical protein DFQ28_002993 [Apophysomyces sp. BC1034]|nr:hypothetical protein DFQ30_006442 [Apophysomyces sp. BC1015]KAG0177266.1 hypothetical protein DFQ29_005043 [Apophysomyces sp. BC1021]KAG0193841.1 hypothetical protein DFQ28_002993 [Apophysomyces sp. BC1034]
MMTYRLPLTEQRCLKSVEYFKKAIEKHDEKIERSTSKRNVNTNHTINVLLRTRPLQPFEIDNGHCNVISQHDHCTYIHEPYFKVLSNPGIRTHTMEVDYAFGPEHDNLFVYDAVSEQLNNSIRNNGLTTILAYGQTGSGKTFTITGILDMIFSNVLTIPTQKDEDFGIYCSSFEIFGNELKDLLDDTSTVQIRESSTGQVNPSGCKEVKVTSMEDYISFKKNTEINRRTAKTLKNDHSSRSHAVYNLRFHQNQLTSTRIGVIMLIDLAGSERNADSTKHDSQLLKESRVTNTSLMTLKDCLRKKYEKALYPNKHIHIPYRSSKLTLLLKGFD